MKEFPRTLGINFKDTFETQNYERLLEVTRRHLHDYILGRRDEEDYFVLDDFCKQHMNNNIYILHDIVEVLTKELENLGWKCKLSFGNTALFIYSTEDPPSSCW